MAKDTNSADSTYVADIAAEATTEGSPALTAPEILPPPARQEPSREKNAESKEPRPNLSTPPTGESN